MQHQFISSLPGGSGHSNHVGTYRRVLPVSLERMYENALDWEHLPYLHASSFSSLEWVDSGAWGWRAWVTGARGGRSLLELRLDKSMHRWITRNLEGPNKGAEIWTHVFERAPREIEIVVDFFVPGVSPEARDKVGRAYATAYETLYDEDVYMMAERQNVLDTRITGIQDRSDIVIGAVDAVAQLPLPRRVTVAGRSFLLNRIDDAWVVYPQRCPHQGAPLEDALIEASVLRCPWHGYAFDVRDGRCVSGQGCHFNVPVAAVEEAGTLLLRFGT